jgi:hypothetical protein
MMHQYLNIGVLISKKPGNSDWCELAVTKLFQIDSIQITQWKLRSRLRVCRSINWQQLLNRVQQNESEKNEDLIAKCQ